MPIVVRAKPTEVSEGTVVVLQADPPDKDRKFRYVWKYPEAAVLEERGEKQFAETVHLDTSGLRPRVYIISVTVTEQMQEKDPETGKVTLKSGPPDTGSIELTVNPRTVARGDLQLMSMRRAAVPQT